MQAVISFVLHVVPCAPPAEVDEFLQQTEKYIKDLTHRLVSYKAKEEAQEAAEEAIAEVRTARFGFLSYFVAGRWCQVHTICAVSLCARW